MSRFMSILSCALFAVDVLASRMYRCSDEAYTVKRFVAFESVI